METHFWTIFNTEETSSVLEQTTLNTDSDLGFWANPNPVRWLVTNIKYLVKILIKNWKFGSNTLVTKMKSTRLNFWSKKLQFRIQYVGDKNEKNVSLNFEPKLQLIFLPSWRVSKNLVLQSAGWLCKPRNLIFFFIFLSGQFCLPGSGSRTRSRSTGPTESGWGSRYPHINT